MAKYRYSATSIPGDSDNHNLRPDHNTSKPRLATQCKAGETVEGNEIWTATKTTAENEAGDIWLHVLSLEGHPINGWMAITHKGEKMSVLTDNDIVD